MYTIDKSSKAGWREVVCKLFIIFLTITTILSLHACKERESIRCYDLHFPQHQNRDWCC